MRSLSVILPTYNRRNLLDLVLHGLSKQSFRDFDVIVVVRPANDGTEDLVAQYRNTLDIKTVFQKTGYVTNALNLGLRVATGDIIDFLDDDAVPAEDLLQRHVEAYEKLDIAGVAGDVVSSKLCNGKLEAVHEKEESPFLYPLSRLGLSLWNKPLPGAQGHFTYVTKSGYVASLGNMAYWRKNGSIKSFLGMGANMSVLRKAIVGFNFQDQSKLGAGWEQILAWYIWKQGYTLIFDPKAKVFHVTHGETLSRELSGRKKAAFQTEMELLFYRLYGKEKGLSVMYRLVSLMYDSMLALKKKELRCLRGKFEGNVLGFRQFLRGTFKSSYDRLLILR